MPIVRTSPILKLSEDNPHSHAKLVFLDGQYVGDVLKQRGGGMWEMSRDLSELLGPCPPSTISHVIKRIEKKAGQYPWIKPTT